MPAEFSICLTDGEAGGVAVGGVEVEQNGLGGRAGGLDERRHLAGGTEWTRVSAEPL